jgi:hypothetical protein
MTEPARKELKGIVDRIRFMRHRTIRDVGDISGREIWSFHLISDLRAKEMQSE